jgi:hypothetical protein
MITIFASSLCYSCFALAYKYWNVEPLVKTFWRNFLTGAYFVVAALFMAWPWFDWMFVSHTLALGFLAFLAFYLLARGLDTQNSALVKQLYFLQYLVVFMIAVTIQGESLTWLLVAMIFICISPQLVSALVSVWHGISISSVMYGCLSATIGGMAIYYVLFLVPEYGSILPNLASMAGAAVWAGVAWLVRALQRGNLKLSMRTIPVSRNGLLLALVSVMSSLGGGWLLTQAVSNGVSMSMAAIFLALSGHIAVILDYLLVKRMELRALLDRPFSDLSSAVLVVVVTIGVIMNL